MASLELHGVSKSYGIYDAVKDVSLTVEDGEFAVFVGPSGCGKSTLLRLIAGLDPITTGMIRIGSEDVTRRLAGKRSVAMVFQSYALYPHMSVYDNIAFPLQMERLAKDQIKLQVEKAASTVRLSSRLKDKPGRLSGGQRQRVAIARAIVRKPEIFLMDEPLSNLDAALRIQMREELTQLHREIGATMIYVTHDQIEAMTMADRIVVINEGRVEQVGSPMDLYHRPANRFVASFIGSPPMNMLKVRIDAASGTGRTVHIAGAGTVLIPELTRALTVGEEIVLGIRPESLSFGPGSAGSALHVRLLPRSVERLGAQTIVHSSIDGQNFTCLFAADHNLPVNDPISVHCNVKDIHVFDDNGQAIPATE